MPWVRFVGGVDSPANITAFGETFHLGKWRHLDDVPPKIAGNGEFEVSDKAPGGRPKHKEDEQ